jgi:hypothetical protein
LVVINYLESASNSASAYVCALLGSWLSDDSNESNVSDLIDAHCIKKILHCTSNRSLNNINMESYP